MNVEHVSKLIQVYILQSLNSGDNSNPQTSAMFELILQSLMKDIDVNGLSQGMNYQNLGVDRNFSSDEFKNSNLNYNEDIKITEKSTMDIESAIKYASQKYGVEEEFIRAIIKNESGFNQNAISKAGAMGLMQLMPSTAKSLGVNNPFDVLENIDGGTRYIKRLINAFNGNKELALSAYNGGIGRMNKRGVDTVEEINKMPKETQKYVDKVMKTYNTYKNL
ncbi:lytic transglycosylase [Fervidicella metallireducens AeB]|uniref:Lytic transglycosylase n=1 Tax=Fervidicella metallireducens AeB TaxID=1403537 RepID=A0A017RZ01_9CLOT|nr:lytic transglycosylase domain-containing protein [Fervidicella metallireducens]EYE89155.1 lytic transglycosylase [Fervidicella metallireducens AeB]